MRESGSSLVSLPRRALIVLDQGPTLMTSFILSYLCKGPICKYSYMGLGVQHMNLWREIV